MTDPSEVEVVRAMHQAALHGGVPIFQVPDIPAGEPLAEEWATFKRELRRLLAGGDQGRFALVKGDQVCSVWDTLRDAVQAAEERFGHMPILIQEVQLFVRPFRSGYCRLSPG